MNYWRQLLLLAYHAAGAANPIGWLTTRGCCIYHRMGMHTTHQVRCVFTALHNRCCPLAAVGGFPRAGQPVAAQPSGPAAVAEGSSLPCFHGLTCQHQLATALTCELEFTAYKNNGGCYCMRTTCNLGWIEHWVRG